MAPSTVTGGGASDISWTFAAPGCNEPEGLFDSGQAFTVRVTVTGDDYGNTGIAEARFGIVLLGDVNNDAMVNVAGRSIVNAIWRGALGQNSVTSPFPLRSTQVRPLAAFSPLPTDLDIGINPPQMNMPLVRVVSFFLISAVTMAHDLNPPDWAGAADTVYAMLEFGIEGYGNPDGLADDYNGPGPAYLMSNDRRADTNL